MDNKENTLEEPAIEYNGPYTYKDYLGFNFDEMVELIRGKIYKMSPAPGSTHQKISNTISYIINRQIENNQCLLFVAPYDVILPVLDKKREKAITVVQPDLSIICNPELIEERGCFGVPDLIIEILSPHTSKKDLQLKYEVYEEAGVKEYWIVMPKEQILEIFVLDNEKYLRSGTFVFEDTIESTSVPGLKVSLEEVFKEKHLY
jgi:Uma2 family endonuclease